MKWIEFEISFGKYHPVCPKNPLNFFLDYAVDNYVH